MRASVKTKIFLEDKKDEKHWDTERDWVLSEPKFSHRNKKQQKYFKTKKVIVYDILVFYFMIKVSGPFKGGRVEGNDDFKTNRSFFPPPTSQVYLSLPQSVSLLRLHTRNGYLRRFIGKWLRKTPILETTINTQSWFTIINIYQKLCKHIKDRKSIHLQE